jgi:hypothetical protein
MEKLSSTTQAAEQVSLAERKMHTLLKEGTRAEILAYLAQYNRHTLPAPLPQDIPPDTLLLITKHSSVALGPADQFLLLEPQNREAYRAYINKHPLDENILDQLIVTQNNALLLPYLELYYIPLQLQKKLILSRNIEGIRCYVERQGFFQEAQETFLEIIS